MIYVRKLLEHYQKIHAGDWTSIEQDYALSWMLYGIAHVNELANTLVFKGGTCLKKCYFGNYRFSQDLDFSVLTNVPKGENLLLFIEEAASIVTSALQDRNNNVQFIIERYLEKQPHPENQEAFTVLVQYPWHRTPLTRIMIEITMSEIIYIPPQVRPIIHSYNEPFEACLQTYSLEEIIAEKISALLSFSKKLHERGWGRSRARDYYDLWCIFQSYYTEINPSIIPPLTYKKCERKQIVFITIEQLFDKKLLEDLNQSWTRWVGPLVDNLPDKDKVLKDLRSFLISIFKDSS